MLDSLSLNPFKFSDAGKKKGSPFGFHMLKKGNNLFDGTTGTPAQCTISGTRYGIVNGVVTAFGPNIPPVEDKGLRACPAFTQLAQKTEDLSTWAKYNSTVSLDGSIRGVNRIFIADTEKTNVHYIEKSAPFGTVSNNSYTNISCVAKYNGRNIRLYVLTKDNNIKTIFFDLKNGSIQIQESNTFASITSLGNGYYQIFFSVFHGTGTTAVASNILLTDDSFNTSYTGDISKGVFISELSYTNTIIPFIPPYVPNNTSSSVSVVSEAATSTTGTSFDLDLPALSRLKAGLRGPNAQGHIYLEVESNSSSAWWPSGVRTTASIFNIAEDDIRGLRFTKNNAGALYWELSDSINAPIVTPSSDILPGQTFRISLDYGTYTDGTQKMRLTVNGVKSSVVAFSGSFGAQDLKFFYGALLHAFFIKLGSFKFIPKPIW